MVDITLYNMDCREYLKTLPDKSIDLILTDPPYKLDIRGAGTLMRNDAICHHLTNRELMPMSDGFDMGILDEFTRVLKKINLYIWCSKAQIPALLNYFVTERKCNYQLITWHKANPIPVSNNRYLLDTEYILFFRQKGVRVGGTFDTKHTYYVQSADRKLKKKYDHPTIKPVNILKNLILNSSNEGDTILDPYAGTGSTGVACKELKRNFIGCEISEKHYKTMVSRLKEIE